MVHPSIADAVFALLHPRRHDEHLPVMQAVRADGFSLAPLSIARRTSIRAVDRALAENRMVLLVTQRDRDEDDPKLKDVKLPTISGRPNTREVSFTISFTFAGAG